MRSSSLVIGLIAWLSLLGSTWASTQVIIGGSNETPSTTGTEYHYLMGHGSVGGWSTLANAEQYIASTGTISKFSYAASAAPDNGAGTDTYVLTVYKNGSPTSLTCTLSESDTSCSDTSNSVSVTAGDQLALESVPSNTPATHVSHFTVQFDSTTSGETALMFTTSASSNNAATVFYAVMGATPASEATESDAQQIMPLVGTVKNLYVELTAAPGAASSGRAYDITVRKNGSNQTVTCQVFETATTCTDLSNSFTVAAGDLLSITRVRTGNPAASGTNIGLTLAADTPGEFVLLAAQGTPASATATNYAAAASGSLQAWSPTETDWDELIQTCTLQDFYMKLTTATDPDNGAGVDSYTYTVRLDASNTALTMTLSDTETSKSITGQSVSVPASGSTDLIAIESVPSNTPDFVSATFGIKAFIASGRRQWIVD